MHHKKDKMQTITFNQSPLTEPDSNNNKKGEKYSLRQRQRRQSSRNKNTDDSASTQSTNASESRKSKPKSKPKAAPLSKYRRKTANARERTRMREINSAFENLRKCVPLSISSGTPTTTNEKLTKITTLRLAMKYIRTLNDVLSKPNSDPSYILSNVMNHSNNNNNNNISSNNNNNSYSVNNNIGNTKDIFSELLLATSNLANNANTNNNSHKKRTSYKLPHKERTKCYIKSEKSPCLPSAMDSPIDIGLMLESDGESLHLSEPCLSPLSQNLKSFSCTTNSALELGLLLDSDNDSLELSEPCLSPLSSLDSLNPFSDLLHSGFSEHSNLDMYLT